MDNFLDNLRKALNQVQKEILNEREKQKQMPAINGTRYLSPDKEKAEAAYNGTLWNYPKYDEMTDISVAENKENLDKIIDNYVSIPTNEDKLKYLRAEYSRLKNPPQGIQNWFKDFSTMTYDLINGQGGWANNDINVIVDAMKTRNNDAFNKYFRRLS